MEAGHFTAPPSRTYHPAYSGARNASALSLTSRAKPPPFSLSRVMVSISNRKLPMGIPTLEHGPDTWAGFFTWENIPGWRWRMRTSKSKYKSAADFDLTKYGLLLPLLDDVPHGNRTGAIVKGEKNLPVRQAMYGRWWRQI